MKTFKNHWRAWLIALIIAATVAGVSYFGLYQVREATKAEYLRGVYDSCMALFGAMTGQGNEAVCKSELRGAVDGAWFDSPSPGFAVPLPIPSTNGARF